IGNIVQYAFCFYNFFLQLPFLVPKLGYVYTKAGKHFGPAIAVSLQKSLFPYIVHMALLVDDPVFAKITFFLIYPQHPQPVSLPVVEMYAREKQPRISGNLVRGKTRKFLTGSINILKLKAIRVGHPYHFVYRRNDKVQLLL